MPRSTGSFQQELGHKIIRLMHQQGLAPGSPLNEARLAEQLGLSRTPVRSALRRLAMQGYVGYQHRGVEMLALPPLPPAGPLQLEDDQLLARIAADRREGRLADQVSEQDLMAAYQLTRVSTKLALTRLATLGVVERKLGYRWKFVEGVYDARARAEAFRFRALVEPSALIEPGYALPTAWARDMAAQHQAFLDAPWSAASGVAFFEMNAAFHEGLVQASGNRFFFEAIRRMNRLRRLSNYDWKHGRERADQSCHEHLRILQLLQAGDVGHAALLMRQHLEQAALVRSDAERAREALEGVEA
jgi:DNA-binding GntR family transcriptional regulator